MRQDVLQITLITDDQGVQWFAFDGNDAPGLHIEEIHSWAPGGAPVLRLLLRPKAPTQYKVINPLGAAVRSMAFERGTRQGWLRPGATVTADGPLQYVDGNQWLPIVYPVHPAFVAVVYNHKNKLVPYVPE